jgi:3-hydroxyisobutyrate dehydrogenase-like beta-hydroxyacid dehydrogenase
MDKPVIGFIGLGLMGAGVAANIRKGGYPLLVIGHRNRTGTDRLVAMGAEEVASPAVMAARADIIFLCVTGSPQVEAIIRGQHGILAGGRRGLVVVDCSTSDPVSTLALEAELRAAGLHLADAPLSRTPKEAEEGTLDTMIGADPEIFARIRPVIDCWAGVVVHLGPVGLGHKMKLINNFVSLGYAALYAEALAVARKAGLTFEQVHSVLGAGRMRCGFYDTFMDYAVNGNENAHRFTVSNAHKDMRYLANMATALGCVTPVQSTVRNAFAAMEAAGQAQRYVPMLTDFTLQANGIQAD